MQGIVLSLRGRVLAGVAALAMCCTLGVALGADRVGAADADRAGYSCAYRAIKVTQKGNRLDAKGRLKCTGSAVRRQVLRVCLLQGARSGYARVKCVVRRRNGPGLFTATASRRCGRGPDVGFITRVRIRVRVKGVGVQTATTQSSDNEFGRNCLTA